MCETLINAMRMTGIITFALVIGGLRVHAAAPGQAAPAPHPATPGSKEADKAKKPPDSNDGNCDLCGSCYCVRKVCVPKPKEREIKKVCWSYKCEDFCVPGPSEYCGKKRGKDECGCWSYDVWRPTCAEVRTKKVPVKTEVKRKVPGVAWSPEERCAACRGKGCDDASCAADGAP